MTVNSATLKLITEFEGFIDHWYPDPAHGWKVPTCCYGHTDAAGKPYYDETKDKVFSKADGEAILAKDLEAVERAVSRLITVPLNANQKGALVSFTFNLGDGNLSKSTLRKKLNANDYVGAAREFKRWNKAGGKILSGLTRRREAERQLFVAPVASEGSQEAAQPPKPAPPIVRTVEKKTAPEGLDKPMVKSKTAWSAIIGTVSGAIATVFGALKELDPIVAIAIVMVIAGAGVVIFLERRKYAKAAREIVSEIAE